MDAALITALILDRPLCVACIAAKSLVRPEQVIEVFEVISTALVLRTETDRCLACGTTTIVYSIARPRLS